MIKSPKVDLELVFAFKFIDKITEIFYVSVVQQYLPATFPTNSNAKFSL